MNETVTDIKETLASMQRQMDSMKNTINMQHEEICNLNRHVQRLTKENADLRRRLAKYETPGKDSNNSSTPPSKESIKAEILRRTKTLRESSNKKIGGQEGHTGTTLKRMSKPDSIVDIAADYCTKCGHSLEDCERVLDYTTQVISLPSMLPITKDIRHYTTMCKNCGSIVSSHYTRKRGSNVVVYDSSVKSLVVYLSVVQFLPYGRIASLLKEVFGLTISEGSMVNWVNKAKKLAQPIIEKIKQYIMSSSIVGFDESGCYCNKRLDWAWIAQTVYYTLVFRGSGRGSKELESRFGDSLERMTAVTDRHSAYFALHFLNHQVCIAHILRELQYLNELDKNQSWSKEVETLLKEAIHERKLHPTDSIDNRSWLKRLDGLIKIPIANIKTEFEQLRKGLIKCRNYIFNFLTDPLIPSDNNASERGIRKLKIKLKNSCTFRSDKGADAFFDIHSIIETAKKHNQTPLHAICALFERSDKFGVVKIAE